MAVRNNSVWCKSPLNALSESSSKEVPMSVKLPSGTPPVHDAGWSWPLALSLSSLVLVLEMLSMSYVMVSMAIPLVATEFETIQGAWMLASVLLVGAVVSPVVGKLADKHGKRLLLLLCIGLTIIGSIISAVAPNYAIMLLGRVFSGFFIATLFLSYSLIRDVFPPKIVPMAVAIATSGMGVVTIPLPFFAGWLVDSLGLRSIFWFTAIILVIAVGLIIATTPESPVRLRARIDPIGALLLGGGVGGVLVAISVGESWGWSSGSTLTYLFAGLALLIAWMISARIVREPLVDLRLFGHRPVIFTAVSAGFSQAASAVVAVVLPTMVMTPFIPGLDLGYGFGASAEGTALYQAPMGAAGVAAGVFVGFLVGRNVKPRLTMIVGMALFALGGVMMAIAHESKLPVVSFSIIIGLATGASFSSTPNLQIVSVPAQLQASTASLVAVFQSLFAAILPVIAFSVMNSHVAVKVESVPLYSNEAIIYGWLIVAGAGALGVVAALLLPRTIKEIDVPPELEAVVVPTGAAPFGKRLRLVNARRRVER